MPQMKEQNESPEKELKLNGRQGNPLIKPILVNILGQGAGRKRGGHG